MAARDAIRSGRIPADHAARIWGGCGTGQLCTICQVVIRPDDFQISIEFPQNGSRWRICHLHVRCCSAWDAARKAFPAGLAHHAPASEAGGPSPNGVSLSRGLGGGSIPARERDPSRKALA